MAKSEIIQKGYQWEIDIVNNNDWQKTDVEKFHREFVWVVCSTGISNKAAMSMTKDFWDLNQNPMVIKHNGKRLAIIKSISEHVIWFNEWKQFCFAGMFQHAIDSLGNLPFIGDVTKYHLARNLGMDCAKPDRHLERLAIHYSFGGERKTKSKIYDKEVNAMCRYISKETGDKIGLVDLVLWRWCNLNPKYYDGYNVVLPISAGVTQP